MRPYYEDENCALYLDDAMRVLADLPTGSVDAIVTDPPYSSGGQFRGDRTQATGSKYSSAEVDVLPDFGGDNRDQRSFLLWMNLWLGEAVRVVRPGGACVLFTDWRQLPTMTDALQVGGWVWRGVVPWAKPWSRPAFKQRAYINQCEYVVWGTAGGATGSHGATEPLAGFYQAASPRDREHQTQKPLGVMRDLVKIAQEGGTVLDPFMGSGTTGAAALIEGRRFIGCELTQHYMDVAVRRCREAQMKAVEKGEQSDLFGGVA